MSDNAQRRFLIIPSLWGDVAVVWTEGEGASLERIFLSTTGEKGKPAFPDKIFAVYPGARKAESEAGIPAAEGEAVEFIRLTLDGIPGVFPLEKIPLAKCLPFQRKVLETEHCIPPGAVGTYRDLACACASPAAVRAVGSALSRNPFPLLIPCHRAIRSDGSLGGYQGGLAMKRFLLESEGISFLPNGNVDVKKVLYTL
ncbi:MAG TPA: MGMT family protein [Rectinemataceae bacterium]|nr:MGMT family protein [Rectinemataceae bacterium]